MQNDVKTSRIEQLNDLVACDLVSIHNFSVCLKATKEDAQNAEPYHPHNNPYPLREGSLYHVDHVFYYVRLASYGDYDGSCQVERANFKCLREKFDWMDSIGGSYGWNAAGVDAEGIASIPDESWNDFIETVSALSDYPSIDDEAVSECELEAENEAWDLWLYRDVVSAIEKQDPELETMLEEMDSDHLFARVHEAMDSANVYFVHESGGNVHLDIKRILPSLIEILKSIEEEKSK